MKKILAMAILVFFLSGCASVCKPPLVVSDTIQQQGRVLKSLKSDLNTAPLDELETSISALIESNKALRKYYSIKEKTNDEPK